MQYFCNVRLTELKNLDNFIGKNVCFGGIVTNVQYRTGKTGKDWAMFTLEGYDESFEFRIFNEEYLKFRHFLVNNQFVFFKIQIKEGWINRDTGKKSDPRITFTEAKLLADVLPSYAKKLSLQLDISKIETNFISQLRELFRTHNGENSVVFEIVEREIEKIETTNEPMPVPIPIVETIVHDNEDFEIETEIIAEDFEEELNDIPLEQPKERLKTITRLPMQSRRLRIKITKELLTELELLQVNFKLN
jgi:DNA polymerase-3 subunit alpha